MSEILWHPATVEARLYIFKAKLLAITAEMNLRDQPEQLLEAQQGLAAVMDAFIHAVKNQHVLGITITEYMIPMKTGLEVPFDDEDAQDDLPF